MKGVRRQWNGLDDHVLRTLHANGRSVKWIAAFMCCATCTIQRRARPLGLVFEQKHTWTPAEDALLRKRYPDEPAAAIAKDLGLRLVQVHQYAHQLGLKKSAAFFESDKAGRIRRGRTDPRMRANQFQKGLTPWNKGTHYTAGGRSAETRFKKGSRTGRANQLYQPIGAERVCSRDGYLERKVNDDLPMQSRWKAVHRLVWEAANGPIPRGHVVRFKPGMKTIVAAEITPDRLELITFEENMRRNTLHRYPKEVVGLIQLKGALNRKINRHMRKQA